MAHAWRAALATALLAVVAAASAPAQTSRETERKLERVRSELKSIAQERRKLEGERGTASRQLRDADEKVGRSSRSATRLARVLRSFSSCTTSPRWRARAASSSVRRVAISRSTSSSAARSVVSVSILRVWSRCT